MTGLVQRLEGIGLVTREADPDDGRATLIAITALGSKELTARRHRHDKAMRARLAHLSTADRAQLTAAVPALIHLMESHV